MAGSQRSCVQCGRELGQETRFCARCGHAAALNSPHIALTGEEEAATGGFDASATRAAPAVPAWDGSTYPPPAGPAYPPPAGPAYAPPAGFGSPPPAGPGSPPLAIPGPPGAPGGSAPPEPSATDTAQFSGNWLDNVGFNPRWEQPAPPPVYDAPGRRPPAPRDSRRLLVLGLFALLAAVIIVPALLILHSLHAIGGSPAAAQPTAKQPSGAAASSAERQRAAAALAGLLAHSVTERGAIVNADVDVNHCGPALGRDAQTFRGAVRSRQLLLRQLGTLPGRSALPGPMLQALSSAWRASITVDQDLARWAQDEASRGCRRNDQADPHLQAANGPDQQATEGKTAFVSMWNPIAAKYGLTQYQTSQL
jgi:hypothetical protein